MRPLVCRPNFGRGSKIRCVIGKDQSGYLNRLVPQFEIQLSQCRRLDDSGF